MTPRRQKRLVIVLALVLGLGATVGLILYALNQNMNLFYTPSELINGKPDGTKPTVGQRLRIGGMVVKGSVERDPKSLRISFKVADIGPSVTVIYDGILPDLFREGQGIVAQGVLINPTTVKASEVLAKHDENYMPPEVADAMKINHKRLQYTEEQLQGK
ncbi:cytochrome c maturation protein CcmE [Photobacterium phosphoreum]|jgi:cytochrome c-type biogenesis protein CcmE|uniref:Cytochrome c-type biogenesis protein CcmE n=1 Tax=Photobacterium phosphoreum TaxID=659 RepID=A0A2T3JXI9_PHOPO|nr:cytochrome c maturation protein CcmE [Photobacterium phosphoreum]KJF88513.1 cytochrome C biogenesis protein CcmE [Photobacterium phosphoreum]MCD9461897.1 cytochrome c maturation protein CcmE [Photobacterium phosphoreum]MCD9470561.1 cytochrome c maturation protein CcmE [Photobacterium phosphoreum]MCD9473319.1 cytochrome c maturation protein CcmE [Photobacterium phosphoreum]MCD9478155.1 cytochrome c maturation protein CcmE [Photobacterium phosphoreum]